MNANTENNIYECQACRQIFQNANIPTHCPRCQSPSINNLDLNQLTLRQLRKISVQNPEVGSFLFRRCYLYSQLKSYLKANSRQIIPTMEEVKQQEIKRQELLNQGYCPHCETPIVALMLDCPQCRNPYETKR